MFKELVIMNNKLQSNRGPLNIDLLDLLQSEVNKVNQYLEDHHWTVTAIHNHQFFEHPTLIYLHVQKQDNRDSLL